MGSHRNTQLLSLAKDASDCQVLAGQGHATPVAQASITVPGPVVHGPVVHGPVVHGPAVHGPGGPFSKCLVCPGGRSCLKCLSGFYAEEKPCYSIGGHHCLSCSRVLCPYFDETVFPRPAVLIPLSDGTSKYSAKLKARRRFYMRCVLGIEIALAVGERVRVFTLSESDYALGMGLDFGSACNKFFTRMSQEYGGAIPRCVVTHHVPGSVRSDRHVICHGTGWLNADNLDKHWHKVYGSKLTGLEEVWSPRGLAFYLVKYLGADEKFVSGSMSPGWVFPGWWQFNLAYHKAHGEYPRLDVFVKLLGLPEAVRKHEVEDLLTVWSKPELNEVIERNEG
jgi:hypothetical protein